MWEGTFNPPLKQGQVPKQETIIMIDDTYDRLSDQELIVFSSYNPQNFQKTIYEVLQAKDLLDGTMMDKFIGVQVQICLSAEDGAIETEPDIPTDGNDKGGPAGGLSPRHSIKPIMVASLQGAGD